MIQPQTKQRQDIIMGIIMVVLCINQDHIINHIIIIIMALTVIKVYLMSIETIIEEDDKKMAISPFFFNFFKALNLLMSFFYYIFALVIK